MIGADASTIRAVEPTRRAVTYAPPSSIVRTTCIRAGFETSISVIVDAMGRGRIGATPAVRPGSGTTTLRESASRRLPCSRSSYVPPGSSFSVPESAGLPDRTSIALIRPALATYRWRPSDLTVSGSSTPSSCTFVPEYAGSVDPGEPAALPGAAPGWAPTATPTPGA